MKILYTIFSTGLAECTIALILFRHIIIVTTHHYASIKELACVMQHTSLILYRFRLSTSASSFSLLIAAYLH
jgi:hypothetical protein